jgi:hypothetical protein
MNPVFQKAHAFTLFVDNGCLNDQMTVLSGITDYTYYINENTEKPAFVQGIPVLTKTWTPTWSQTVEGCPVMQKLYRTPLGGTRTPVTSFETTPIFQFDFTQIPLNVLWTTTKATTPGYDPFSVTMSLTTSDYTTYDLQSWALSVVLESTRSTSANKEGVINFKLDFKDVCWDLPLTGGTVQNPTQVQDIWALHQLTLTYLMDSWNDYCQGSSYKIQYVSGPKLPVGGDPLTININAFYTDKT